jgi:hypothetical protein
VLYRVGGRVLRAVHREDLSLPGLGTNLSAAVQAVNRAACSNEDLGAVRMTTLWIGSHA